MDDETDTSSNLQQSQQPGTEKRNYLRCLLKVLPCNFMSPESPHYSPVATRPEAEFTMEDDKMEMSGGCRYMDNPPEPYLIQKYKRENKRVTLNVGGERHEVMWKTLDRIPHCRLGRLRKVVTHEEILELVDDYSLIDNEFYFDRQPVSFSSIINFYRNGKLHLTNDVCVMDFSDDLSYWGIDSIFLEDCCEKKFALKQEKILDEIKKEEDAMKEEEEEDFGRGPFAKIQKFGWDTLEKPTSSTAARVVAVISILFIVISTTSLAVNTMPKVQIWECNNQTDLECARRLKEDPPRPGVPVPTNVHQVDNVYLAAIEGICIAWFTLEFMARFVFCPDKKGFLQSPLNFIDVLAIMPYYLTNFIMDEESHGGGDEDDGFNKAFRKFVQVFRLMRILRIFKLGRHSRGLKSLGYTVTTSYKELGILVTFLGMGVLIFSCVEFFAEMEDNREQFESIPHTFWWALITMTTVGYGDISPVTGIGQLVGSFCAILGVLVIALPIPIIGNNFVEYYQNDKQKEEKRMRRLAMDRAKKESVTYQRDKAARDCIANPSANSSRAKLHLPSGF